MTETERKFMSLYKNRLALCTPDGYLKSENRRYKKSYVALLNEVGKMFSDDVSKLYPLEITIRPKECKEVLEENYGKFTERIFKALTTGTYTDLEKIKIDFHNLAQPIYIKYLKKGISNR